MEIGKNAILRIVKAERAASKLEKELFSVIMLNHQIVGENMIGSIDGALCDAIYSMIGEELLPEQDFEHDSVTMKLLNSEMSDEEVAEEIIRIAEKNAPKMPKPNLISRVQFLDMIRKFGGYPDVGSTPEGEWPK